MKRVGVVIAWTLSVACALALGLWAGRATLAPPDVDAQATEKSTLYTVTEQTVGRTMSFPAKATWESTPLATGAAEGTVTAIRLPANGQVNVGDTLFAVDLRPVVIAQGETPSFRELAEGATGDDVRQLRTLLHALKYLPASTSSKFDAATTSAVKRWQKAQGLEPDGVVRAGDVVYASTLPARVRLAPEVVVGSRIEPGTPVAYALSSAPTFEIVLDAAQAGLVPTTGAVLVDDLNGGKWSAVISGATTDEQDHLVLTLTGPDGSAVCGASCDAVPAAADGTLFPATIIVVPEATGPAVPSAALATEADGSAYVVMEDGSHRDVEVIATGDGRAVLNGVTDGERVLLFGDAAEESKDRSATSDGA